MKLRVLAIAIAAASMTVSVQAADIKFGGDFHVGHKSGEDYELRDYGSELWFDIEKKSGGLTFFAHAELELDGGIHHGSDDKSTTTTTTTTSAVTYIDPITGDEVAALAPDGVTPLTVTTTTTDTNDVDVDDLEVDEIYVGVKGSFGTLRVGDIENACDKLEYGGDWNEFLAASDSRGDCGGEHEGTILYTKKMGDAEIGVSHNSDHDESSVAIRYKVNKNLRLALGHVKRKGDLDNITSGSITAHKGKFSLKARVNDHETSSSGDNGYSVFAAYKPTKKDNFNIGTDNDETVSVGYNREVYKNSKLFLETRTKKDKDAEYAIGVQYKF